MKDFPGVEVVHSQSDILCDENHAFLIEFYVFLVKQIEKAASFQVFREHEVVWACELRTVNADSHVKENIGVAKVADDFDLLDEIRQLLPMEFGIGLPEVLYRNVLSQPFSIVNISVPAFPNLLNDLKLLRIQQEICAYPDLLQGFEHIIF